MIRLEVIVRGGQHKNIREHAQSVQDAVEDALSELEDVLDVKITAKVDFMGRR